eukprot:COSAG02_NODE_996_length_15338_cov_3.867577_2_plen_103_part_00
MTATDRLWGVLTGALVFLDAKFRCGCVPTSGSVVIGEPSRTAIACGCADVCLEDLCFRQHSSDERANLLPATVDYVTASTTIPNSGCQGIKYVVRTTIYPKS